MKIGRRELLTGAASAGLLSAAAPKMALAQDNPLRLGSIMDQSGIFDVYGRPMNMAINLAVADINASGGLLGEQIETVNYDTQSDMSLYTQYAQQLARRDQVDVVHGGILSASREAMRPTLRRSEVLYFYNVFYEGGVCDRNIFITGLTPAQQVEALIPEAISTFGRKVYILAADYNYGQITARWMRRFTEENGGEVLATDFFPLDVGDFASTITNIQQAQPDLVISALVGGAHMSFYRQWAAAGMNAEIPMASTVLGAAAEHLILTPDESDGIMVAFNYSKEDDNPANAAFQQRWADAYGDTSLISEGAVSNYQGVMLWAEGVRQAGSRDRMAVIEALESGLSIDAPSGRVTIDPQTHHVIADLKVMEIRDQRLNVIKRLEQVPPRDTQAVCNLIENPNDNTQYEIDI